MSTDVNEALGVSPQQQKNVSPQGKYSSLKSIAGIISVMAWITGGLMLILSIIAISNQSRNSFGGRDNSGLAILTFLLYIYLGVFVVVSLLAQAGIIRVLVDIEENTRKNNPK